MWIDCERWQERWSEIERLARGGQGQGRKGIRNEDELIGFIKTLNNNRDQERRSRFFREAVAYETLSTNQVPRLIETNAHLHSDLKYVLFTVVDFIEGPTLELWRSQINQINIQDAIVITKNVIGILKQIHNSDIIHRDIKPDNIILKNSDPNDVNLLDFGLSYRGEIAADFNTELPQELGNRFLRLPELSAGSFMKQDERTDLTFAAAILFFLLIGEAPNILQDADAKLPHQRENAMNALSRIEGLSLPRLRAFFDQAFAPTLNHRYSSADNMLQALAELEKEGGGYGGTAKDRLSQIKAHFNSETEYRKLEIIKKFRILGEHLSRIANDLNTEIPSRFKLRCIPDSHKVDVSEYRSFFWDETRSAAYGKSNLYARQIGNDLVLFAGKDVLYATEFESPKYDDEFRDAMMMFWISQLESVLENDID